MFNRTNSKYDQVEKDARQLADSISQLMKEGTKDQGEAFQGKMKDFVGASQEKMREAKRYVQEKGEEVDRYAHDHVWTTVGIAAGVGAFLGVLLSKMIKK